MIGFTLLGCTKLVLTHDNIIGMNCIYNNSSNIFSAFALNL